jgi:hypothetical protein
MIEIIFFVLLPIGLLGLLVVTIWDFIDEIRSINKNEKIKK